MVGCRACRCANAPLELPGGAYSQVEVIEMLTAVLIVVGALVVVSLVVVVLWVRRVASDMDYPEAHGAGLTPEESDAIRLGTSLASGSAFLGGH